MEEILSIFTPVVSAYAGEHGWLLQAISIIGTLRVLIKPAMMGLEAYVAKTEDQSDDALPAKIKGHMAYKVLIMLTDWIVSIPIQRLKKKDEHSK